MPKPKNKRKIGYLGNNPMIRLSGKYLVNYGFEIGGRCLVEYKAGQITIATENKLFSQRIFNKQGLVEV